MNHPGIELQLLIKEKGLTQKAFASILGKKVSEVNELLKGKRNITIQWDYLLHQNLGTPIKYWILKQVDYDYSLLDIEESIDTNPSFGTKGRIQEDIKPIDPSDDKSVSEGQEKPEDEIGGHSEQSEESRETGHSVDSSVASLPQNDNNDVILSDSLSSGAGGIYSASGESTTHQTHHSEALAEESSINNLASLDSSTSPRSSLNDNITQNENKSQETPTKEQENKDDEDHWNRAKIFRSF